MAYGDDGPWMPEDDEKLRVGFQTGMRDAHIARAIGRTTDAVGQRRVKLRMVTRKAHR